VRDNRNQHDGEHPPQIFELLCADIAANRPDHIVAGENDEEKTNPSQSARISFGLTSTILEKNFFIVATLLWSV
jgi:hypothetical protein